MDLIDRVKLLIAEYLEQNGIELVDISYRRESGGMVLRLLADTTDGITIDECERLNNFLSDSLDRHNIISDHYTLEVASPGLDRHLVTDRDFARVMAKEVEIRTYEPIDGMRDLRGKLIGMDKENVVIEACGISTVVPRAKIAKAVLKVDIS